VVEGRVWAIVPRATAKLAQLDTIDGLDLRYLLMGDERCCVHTLVFAIFRVLLLTGNLPGLLELALLVIDALVGLIRRKRYFADAGVGYPFIHAAVDALIVHVVLVTALNLLLCCVVIYYNFTKWNNEEKSMKIYSIRL